MCFDTCCKEKLVLLRYLLIFALIALIMAVIAIFIRTAKTNRYEEALMYLEERNNGTFNFTVFTDCKKKNFLSETFCNVDGKKLCKPNEEVSCESLFKNWNKAELGINISRAIISAIFLLFEYFVIHRKIYDVNFLNEEMKNKYLKLLKYLSLYVGFLMLDNCVCLFIRAIIITANNNIGVYEEGSQNSFTNKMAVQICFDFCELLYLGFENIFIKMLKLLIKKEIFIGPTTENNERRERQVVTIANEKGDYSSKN